MIFRSPNASSYERIHRRIVAQWLLQAGGGSAVIAFASQMPGEGVSTTVAGLARAFGAADPGGTLVVDAAMAGTRVARYLRAKAKRTEAGTPVPDEIDLPSTMSHVQKAQLDVLTLAPGGDGQAVNTDRTRKILESLKQRYRIVLVDAGILNDSRGACWLICSDYRVLVVDAGQATRELLEYYAKQLEHTGIRFDGSILNKRPDYIPRLLYPLVR